MLNRLIDFVVTESREHPFKLTLEDVALCKLWCDGQERRNADHKAIEPVRKRVAAWIACPDEPELNTAGRRHQRVLRSLIRQIEQGHREKLAADELALLCAAWELCSPVTSDTVQARLRERLADCQEELHALRARVEPSDDLHQLAIHIQYATPADIRNAPVSSIRLLAGIELPCRGPIFKAGNHLRILGDVPEDCTVVVENEASCSVDGYVLGRVLAKNYCEIRHNISGVAIVLRGHIRARSIINNAVAVSKMGEILCRNAQGPKLVFAGSAIHVWENTMMGRFITRDMTVSQEVRGSHLEVAGTAHAGAFRNLGMSNVNVVLRRELSCEDFGEVTGGELRQLLSQAYTLRRKAHNFKNLAEAARLEAEHSAQSCLMYIFGGGEVQKRLQGVLYAQRRHKLVSNVVDNLEHILEQAQDGFFGDVPGNAEELKSGFGDTEDDIDNDKDLLGARAEAEKLQKSLRAKNLNRLQRTLLLDEVREKLSEMRVLQQEAEARLRDEERSIQHLEKYEQVLAGSGAGATKTDVLAKILPAMQKQPAESVMGKRLRSNFIVRALRGVERAVRHQKEFSVKAEESLTGFRAVTDRLGKDYQIRVLENPESEEEPARVTGIFDSGVRVFLDVYLENLAEVPRESLIVTDHNEHEQTFLRPGAGSRFYSSSRDA